MRPAALRAPLGRTVGGKNNVFRADANATGPVFSIVVPPPNVTGSMHIGHMRCAGIACAAITRCSCLAWITPESPHKC